MKKFMYLIVAVIMATIAASCNYKSVETPLNNELISFTAKTDDGNIVYGVKTKDGKEIIPARYNSISMLGDNILAIDNDGQWLYTLSGRLVLDAPCFDISEKQGDYILSTRLFYYRYVPRSYDTFYLFQQDDLECIVYDKSYNILVFGGRIIYLFSEKDKQFYFIALNGEKRTIAYDDKGNKLFELDREKVYALPAPEWTDCSVEKRTTEKSIEEFKASKQ